jgi:hypothetical protein
MLLLSELDFVSAPSAVAQHPGGRWSVLALAGFT